MFSGVIDNSVIYSSHAVVVVDHGEVVGSFQTPEDAERFIRGGNRYGAQVFTHNGQGWGRHPFEYLNRLIRKARVVRA